MAIKKKLLPLGVIDILFYKLREVRFVGDIDDLNSFIKTVTSVLDLLIDFVELIRL